jgi:hypothetical protein
VDGQVMRLVFIHVLENGVDPTAAVIAARRLIAPDGHLHIDPSQFLGSYAVHPYHPLVPEQQPGRQRMADARARRAVVLVDRQA